MTDLSKYSNEELMKIAQGAQVQKSSMQSEPTQEEPGFFNKLGKGYLNYAGGALRGMGQAAGDFGASVANWPISGIERLTGAQLPHVPHPDLINKNPGSLGESVGQALGQLTGAIALPGGAGMKAAQLAGRGYEAARAGSQLPLIGKLLAGGAGGALEGAAGNEENRGLGATIGSLGGAAGYAVPALYNFGKSLGSKSIAKNIQEEVSRIGQHFRERFDSHLLAGEEAGANDFLKSQKANIKLLKKAGEGKLVYGLEKFNESPTLTNAHRAQSDLNKIVSKLSRSREGTLEADAHEEALKLKNRLLKNISESFEKAGVKEHGAGYQQSRVDYANQAAPYLDSPTISGLLGKNKRGVQTVRPKEFADKLLEEEEFLAQAGKKHPDLLRREKYNRIKKNKLAQGAALGAGTLATGFLPYEIRKILGTH
jgi:hypothetical protein